MRPASAREAVMARTVAPRFARCSECGRLLDPGTGDDWWLEGVVWAARTHEGACSDARASRLLSGVSS